MTAIQRVPIVLLDLDGVVVDFDQRLCELLRPLVRLQQPWTAHAVDPDRPDEGCISCDRKHFRVSNARWKQDAHRIMSSPGFFLHAKPYPGAHEVVQRLLAREDLAVFFCSSPMAGATITSQDKIEWVREHFGLKGEQRLILTHDKTMVQGDVLVDDHPNPTGQLGSHPAWKQLMFVRSYNAHLCTSDEDDRKFVRAWEDVEKMLDDMLFSHPRVQNTMN